MKHNELVDPLMEMARNAGEAIMEIYRSGDMRIESKEDESPLTQADRASNNIIMTGLQKLDPAYPIISEENKAIDYSARKEFQRFWMVDPLDGTKEFIKQNGEFTVNIALIENQRPTLGVVYAPALDEMYVAIKGKGAVVVKAGEKHELTCQDFRLEDEELRVVCSRSHLNEETKRYLAGLNAPTTVAIGSSLKFLLIARGEADLYPRLGPTMEWDTAAAHIIVEEAGGQVLQYEDRKPLIYNKENLLNPYFVVYGHMK